MLVKKVRKFMFLVICFFWLASDFFIFTIKPGNAQTSVQQGCISMPTLCAELVDTTATKTALTTFSEGASNSQVPFKVVERGSEAILNQGSATPPFAATLGKWGAAVGLGGLLTFVGIPSLDDARQSLIDQYGISHPATLGQTGKVAGRMYAAQISWTSSSGGGSSTGDMNIIGPVSLTGVYVGMFTISASFTDGYGANHSSSANVYTASPGFAFIGVKFVSGVSEEQDKSQDPNATTPPTNWANATQAQRDTIVNNTTNEQIQNLYSVAPVTGVPSPSGTEDVYFKPAGSQEWVKLNNPTPQTINNDTNGDGVPDLNIDTNHDGVPDLNIDTNHDGTADINVKQADGSVLNIDTNSDGIADLNVKQADGSVINKDINGDGIADINIKQSDGSILNRDVNGDNIPDVNIPKPGGGLLNEDTNGDGIADKNIDTNHDGKADVNVTDASGNVLNEDTNGDGIPDKNVDANGDGISDPYQPANGTLDEKTFQGTFFISYAAEKLSAKFPFDIIGTPTSGAASNECPNYTFFDEVIELCILRDAFKIILIPFKIGLAAIFYQKI